MLPPPDLRTQATGRDATAYRDVDAWLNWAYYSLAEPLAEGEICESDSDNNSDVDENTKEFSERDAAEGSAVSIRAVLALDGPGGIKLQKRFLPPGSFQELFEQYEYQRKEDASSVSTFSRVWHSKWRRFLKFRHLGQHARCSECAKYSQMRKNAKSEAEREQIQAALQHHWFYFMNWYMQPCHPTAQRAWWKLLRVQTAVGVSREQISKKSLCSWFRLAAE